MQTILISEGNENLRDLKAEEIIKSHIDISKPTTDLYIVSAIDGKASISIAQVREMISIAHLQPRNNDKAVIWIKQANTLTVEAQNAMLKILEEPPEYLIFVLTADHHENLIDTVRSRCSIVRLGKVDGAELDDGLSGLGNSDGDSDGLDDLLVFDIRKLLEMNPGEIIDWVNENIQGITRSDAVKVLNLWEKQMKELLDEVVNNDGAKNGAKISSTEDSKNSNENDKNSKTSPTLSVKYINSIIEDLYKTRERILQNNANIKLTIEGLLLGISANSNRD